MRELGNIAWPLLPWLNIPPNQVWEVTSLHGKIIVFLSTVWLQNAACGSCWVKPFTSEQGCWWHVCWWHESEHDGVMLCEDPLACMLINKFNYVTPVELTTNFAFIHYLPPSSAPRNNLTPSSFSSPLRQNETSSIITFFCWALSCSFENIRASFGQRGGFVQKVSLLLFCLIFSNSRLYYYMC